MPEAAVVGWEEWLASAAAELQMPQLASAFVSVVLVAVLVVFVFEAVLVLVLLAVVVE